MEPNNASLFSLTIDPVTKSHLTETAKWARFLAIIGMIVLIFALAATVFSVLYLGRLSGFSPDTEYAPSRGAMDSMRMGIIAGSVIMLIVAFFPLLFLLRFANGMRSAIAANDQSKLNTAFQNLKVYFRYLGIIVLVVLIIYALAFVVAIIGTAAFS